MAGRVPRRIQHDHAAVAEHVLVERHRLDLALALDPVRERNRIGHGRGFAGQHVPVALTDQQRRLRKRGDLADVIGVIVADAEAKPAQECLHLGFGMAIAGKRGRGDPKEDVPALRLNRRGCEPPADSPEGSPPPPRGAAAAPARRPPLPARRMPVTPSGSRFLPSARRRAGIDFRKLEKVQSREDSKMTRSAAALVLVLLAWPLAAPAQQVATNDTLNDTQTLGRRVFAQSCGVCHLPPQINARTFGPALSKDTAGGNDDVIRGVISDGTPRMPGFKHYLERGEIDAIIAYLKTVPATATR